MRFGIIGRISIPSRTAALNEDAADATKNAAWVVDGATGVSDLPPLVPDLTDAAWLAGQLNNKLHRAFASAAVETHAALAGIEADIRAQFIRTNKLPERTAFALSVLAADTVHLIGLGDCRIIFENDIGEVQEFDPSERGHADCIILRSTTSPGAPFRWSSAIGIRSGNGSGG